MLELHESKRNTRRHHRLHQSVFHTVSDTVKNPEPRLGAGLNVVRPVDSPSNKQEDDGESGRKRQRQCESNYEDQEPNLTAYTLNFFCKRLHSIKPDDAQRALDQCGIDIPTIARWNTHIDKVLDDA